MTETNTDALSKNSLDKIVSITFILFVIELLCASGVAWISVVTDDMGLGGVVFLLPILACYSFLLSIIPTLIVMPGAVLWRKRRLSASKKGVLGAVMVVNIVAFCFVLYFLASLFIATSAMAPPA